MTVPDYPEIDPAFAPPPGYINNREDNEDVEADDLDDDELHRYAETVEDPEDDEDESVGNVYRLHGAGLVDGVRPDPQAELETDECLDDEPTLWRADEDTESWTVDGVPTDGPPPNPISDFNGLPRYRVVLGHTRRLPRYWGRASKKMPKGLKRGCAAWVAWIRDVEGRESIRAIRAHDIDTARGNPDDAEEHHGRRIRNRVKATAVAVGLSPVAILIWLSLTPILWSLALLSFLVVVVPPAVGLQGRDDDDPPIVERIIYKGSVVEDVTQGLIAEALIEAVPKVAKKVRDSPGSLRFLSQPTRMANDEGAICTLDLPPGVAVSDIEPHLDQVAGGVSRDASCLLLAQVSVDRGGTARMVEMTILDRPLRARGVIRAPIADKPKRVDIFQPFGVGSTLSGATLTASIFGTSVLVGAVPRMGKTALLRLLLSLAALDPRTRLIIGDYKGAGDFDHLGGAEPGQGVAEWYETGQGSQDDKACLLNKLQEEVAAMERRAQLLAEARRTMPCPSGQVTSEMAASIRGLAPVVIAIDEAQRVLDEKEIVAALDDLMKTGPALGIIVILSSQAADGDTLPKNLTRMATVRAALKTTDTNATLSIMGQAGVPAHRLAREDKGVAYVIGGEGDGVTLCRLYNMEDEDLAKVAAKARQLRENADTLTGRAVGDLETDAEPERPLLLDLVDAWPVADNGGPARAASAVDLLKALSEQWPDRWPPAMATKAATDTMRAAARAAGWPEPDKADKADRRPSFVRSVTIGERRPVGVRWAELANLTATMLTTADEDPDEVEGVA